MADLPIAVIITTPLPVAVTDFPKLETIARAACDAHGIDYNTATMKQIGNDLVITYGLLATTPKGKQ